MHTGIGKSAAALDKLVFGHWAELESTIELRSDDGDSWLELGARGVLAQGGDGGLWDESKYAWRMNWARRWLMGMLTGVQAGATYRRVRLGYGSAEGSLINNFKWCIKSPCGVLSLRHSRTILQSRPTTVIKIPPAKTTITTTRLPCLTIQNGDHHST